MSSKNRGRFITLEGGEGAGKSTLMEKLAAHIPNSITTFEPGDTSLGSAIRTILLESKTAITPHAELLLFLADRAQHVQECILPHLEKGVTVICDRFSDSSLAYQGAARALDIGGICAFAAHHVVPDLTLYLDIDPAIGLKRTTTLDRLESEAIDFHQRVREGFQKLANDQSDRIKTIDASQSAEAVFQEALLHL